MKVQNVFSPSAKKRFIFFVLADLAISGISFYLSYALRFNFDITQEFANCMWVYFSVLVFLKLVSIYVFGIYHIAWRYFSIGGLDKIIKAHVVAYIIFVFFVYFFASYVGIFPRSIVVIDFFLSIMFISSLRIAKRYFLESRARGTRKTIIIGTKRAALVIRYINDEKSDLLPIGFFDTDNSLVGTSIFGIRVYALDDLSKVLSHQEVEIGVIASDYSSSFLDEIFKILYNKDIKDIRIFDAFKTKMKELSIEDLLARNPKDLDKQAIGNFIKNKTILITGAGGSIGSELARQCSFYGAKKLILVDSSELAIYALMQKIGDKADIFLRNILDEKTMRHDIFEAFDIDVVLHAAACKHVNIVEKNQAFGVQTNVLGTKTIIDLSIEYEVNHFVLISTDKAVRPTSIMGATKRVCELYAQNVHAHKTKINAVRFGNVLGSSGSVVPLFRRQIEKNMPLTVTHKEVRRFFMLTKEACELVLQAASLGSAGEIFILDMGEPVKIIDLAKKMLFLHQKEYLPIEIIGLKAGEKLYEELLISDDDKATKYPSIFIAKKTPFDIDVLNGKIKKLLNQDNKEAVLMDIVKEFKRP